MAMAAKRLSTCPLFVNLAFSSFHDWLPGISEGASKILFKIARRGCIQDSLLRHGRPPKLRMEWSLIAYSQMRGEQAKEPNSFGKSFTFTPSHWSLQLLEPWTAQIFLAAG
jgi:hypothetical protein